jgi:virulence factor Mce-like protein
MQPMKILKNPITWGVTALATAVAVAATAGLLYVNPPQRQIVTFYTQDAASIRPGDQVRIAGITVGKVKDLSLETDRVRVRAQIDDTAFVGDQSQVQVRMLTVVGGYYVNVQSLGDAPLGSNPIPVERTNMPYNLMRTLADATKITDNVEAVPINQSLEQLSNGLSGNNRDSISAIIDAGNSLMSTIDRQRGQISNILALSDEYIRALSNFREELKALVLKISVIEQTLVLYSKGFGSALAGMGDIVEAIAPIGEFYLNHRDKFLTKVRDWQHKARLWIDRNGIIVRGLGRIRDKLERVLDGQNARPELLATDLCMPVPGSGC